MTRAKITIPIELGEVIPLQDRTDRITVSTLKGGGLTEFGEAGPSAAESVEVFVVCRWPDGTETVTVMGSTRVGYGYNVEVRLA